MNKTTFLETLEKGLKNKQVHDIKDIIDDYQEYFDIQITQGKKEEEIASSLGSIESIVSDYALNQSGSKKKWFELVTISFVALPLLIMCYGLLIAFAASSLGFWGVSVYLAFDIDTLNFMPNIPLFPKLFYIATALASCVFMFSFSVRFYSVLKSMTKQYVVKQSIRIGEFIQSPIYIKIFKISFWTMTILFVLTYIISALTAKSFQYWHVWEWFQ
jgi:hypothetical protein